MLFYAFCSSRNAVNFATTEYILYSYVLILLSTIVLLFERRYKLYIYILDPSSNTYQKASDLDPKVFLQRQRAQGDIHNLLQCWYRSVLLRIVVDTAEDKGSTVHIVLYVCIKFISVFSTSDLDSLVALIQQDLAGGGIKNRERNSYEIIPLPTVT